MSNNEQIMSAHFGGKRQRDDNAEGWPFTPYKDRRIRQEHSHPILPPFGIGQPSTRKNDHPDGGRWGGQNVGNYSLFPPRLPGQQAWTSLHTGHPEFQQQHMQQQQHTLLPWAGSGLGGGWGGNPEYQLQHTPGAGWKGRGSLPGWREQGGRGGGAYCQPAALLREAYHQPTAQYPPDRGKPRQSPSGGGGFASAIHHTAGADWNNDDGIRHHSAGSNRAGEAPSRRGGGGGVAEARHNARDPAQVVAGILEGLVMSARDVERRQVLIKRLGVLAKDVCGSNARLEMFGSSACGLAHVHSDLDLSLAIYASPSTAMSKNDKTKSLKALLSHCLRNGMQVHSSWSCPGARRRGALDAFARHPQSAAGRKTPPSLFSPVLPRGRGEVVVSPSLFFLGGGKKYLRGKYCLRLIFGDLSAPPPLVRCTHRNLTFFLPIQNKQGKAILQAKTPIIKLYDPVCDVHVDVACPLEGDNAARVSALLSSIVLVDERFRVSDVYTYIYVHLRTHLEGRCAAANAHM